MVHSDADGRVVFLADVQEGDEPRTYLLYLACILFIGVFQVFEGAGGVDVVARIDAHFLGIEGGHFSHVRIEVHVGDEWRQVAFGAQGGVDVAQVFRLGDTLRGEPHILSAGVDDAFGLLHAGFRVARRRVGHRLDADGVRPAQGRRAYLHFVGRAAFVVKQVDHDAGVF